MKPHIELCSVGPRYANDLLHETIHSHDVRNLDAVERWYDLFNDEAVDTICDVSGVAAGRNFNLASPNNPYFSQYAQRDYLSDTYSGIDENAIIRETHAMPTHVILHEGACFEIYHLAADESYTEVESSFFEDFSCLSPKLQSYVRLVRYDSRFSHSKFRQRWFYHSQAYDHVCEDRAETGCWAELAAIDPLFYWPIISKIHRVAKSRQRIEVLADEGLLRESTADLLLDSTWRDSVVADRQELLFLIEGYQHTADYNADTFPMPASLDPKKGRIFPYLSEIAA